jgi:hypothetical protein
MAYKFTQEFLKDSYTYASYRRLITKLLSESKTTGNNQESSMIKYARLNVQRMNRIDKTTVISEELKGLIKKKQNWVLISEGWCGDAANNVPVIAKMAGYSENADLHIILRDDNPEIMDEYLTNGGRAIPKLIVLDENYNELFVWGPRPAVLQKYVMDYKKENVFELEELKTEVHMLYFKDKNISTQNEIIELLKGVK